MYPRRLTRRQFMSRSAAAAAGFLTSACIGPSLSTSPEPRPSYGSSPSSIDTRWPIDRVVYVMLENRSYDNIFGRYPGPTARRRGSGSAPRCRFAAAPSGCPETFRTIPSPGTRRTTTAGWMGSRSVTSVRRGRIHSSIARTSQLLPLGGQLRAVRQHLRVRPWPVLSEPPVLRRGPGRRCHRQPGEHPNDARTAPSSRAGLRRLRGRRVRPHGCRRRHRRHPSTCFEFDSVGAALTRQNIDWASYSPTPTRPATSGNRTRRSPRCSTMTPCGPPTSGRSTTWCETSRRTRFHRSRGSFRGSNSPITRRSARGMRTTGSRASSTPSCDPRCGRRSRSSSPGTSGGLLRPCGATDDRRSTARVPGADADRVPARRPGSIDSVPHDFCAPLRFICDNWGVPYITDRIALGSARARVPVRPEPQGSTAPAPRVGDERVLGVASRLPRVAGLP